MAIEHHFYMDTTASRHALRDMLVRAGLGFEAEPDWEVPSGGFGSGAFTEATTVSIHDDLSGYASRPDNGVIATRRLTFRDRKLYLDEPGTELDFETQTVRGIMALLRGYPDADAYWVGWDAEVPMLLRRGGRLVLSEALTRPGRFWSPERAATRSLVDLPYTVEPLGPWPSVPLKAPEPVGRR